MSADRAAVERVLHRIPRDRLDDGPDLLVCAAARLFLDGAFRGHGSHTSSAPRTELQRRGQQAHSGTHVTCLLLSMAVLRARGDVDGVRRAATTALDELSGPALSLPAASEYRAVALGNLGTALLWSGRLDEAEQRLTEGLVASAGTRLDASRINMLAHLALVATATGRLGAGVDYATEAIELVEARGWAPLAQAATAYLALRDDPPPPQRPRRRPSGCSSRARRQRPGSRPLGGPSRSPGPRMRRLRSAGCRPPGRGWPPCADDLDGRQLPPFLASLAAARRRRDRPGGR